MQNNIRRQKIYFIHGNIWYGTPIEPNKVSVLLSCSPRIFVEIILKMHVRTKGKKAIATFKCTVLYMSLISIPYAGANDFHPKVETRANMSDTSNINDTI